jgi:hypothetical protein
MINVNHLIARQHYRKNSRIPWIPAVRAENRPQFRRPTEVPDETSRTGSVLSHDKMKAAWGSICLMSTAQKVRDPQGTVKA